LARLWAVSSGVLVHCGSGVGITCFYTLASRCAPLAHLLAAAKRHGGLTGLLDMSLIKPLLFDSLPEWGSVQFGMKGCVVRHTCRSFARASLTSSLRSIAQVGDAWRVERTRVTNTLPHPVILSESEESKPALGRTAAGSPRLRSLCFAAQQPMNPWGLVGRDFICFAAAQHDRLARRVIRERAHAHPEIKYLLQWTTPPKC